MLKQMFGIILQSSILKKPESRRGWSFGHDKVRLSTFIVNLEENSVVPRPSPLSQADSTSYW